MQARHLRGLLEHALEEIPRGGSRSARRAGRQVLPPGLPATGCSSTPLSVAQGVSALAATFPGIDRDVAVAGALLQDISKIDAYSSRAGGIDLTDAGKLQGEIPLGYFLVRREIESIARLPA